MRTTNLKKEGPGAHPYMTADHFTSTTLIPHFWCILCEKGVTEISPKIAPDILT
jgi:hypothetical protein